MAEARGRRNGARSGSDDPLMREVRWRLFRHEDLPARLRRLDRLEKAAEVRPPPGDPPPGNPLGAR